MNGFIDVDFILKVKFQESRAKFKREVCFENYVFSLKKSQEILQMFLVNEIDKDLEDFVFC